MESIAMSIYKKRGNVDSTVWFLVNMASTLSITSQRLHIFYEGVRTMLCTLYVNQQVKIYKFSYFDIFIQISDVIQKIVLHRFVSSLKEHIPF